MKLPCIAEKWQCPLIDRMSGGVFVYNLDKELVYHNAAGLRILGLESASEHLREFSKDRYFGEDGVCLDPDDYPLSKCIREGRAIKDEVLGFVRGGIRRWIIVSSSPIEGEGQHGLILVSFMDYTAFKEAEDRLDSCLKDMHGEADAEERLLLSAKVFAAIEEGVVVTTADGAILSVNKSFTGITGYSPEDVLGKNPRILKSSYHDAAFYRGMWESLLERGKWQGEIINRRKDGTALPRMAVDSRRPRPRRQDGTLRRRLPRQERAQGPRGRDQQAPLSRPAHRPAQSLPLPGPGRRGDKDGRA